MTHNDLGKTLVEDCARISVNDLLSSARTNLTLSLMDNKLKIDGAVISLTASCTGNGGTRYWFVCPITGKRCGVLYRHPVSGQIGSRLGLGLRYLKSAKKGMIESETMNMKTK